MLSSGASRTVRTIVMSGAIETGRAIVTKRELGKLEQKNNGAKAILLQISAINTKF